MISDAQRLQVKDLLDDMVADVRLLVFTQSLGCETCGDTKRILDVLAEISPRVTVDEKNLVIDRDDAERYGITHAPAIVVLGKEADGTFADHRIRLLGAPFGYEFTSLMDAILAVSRAAPGLSDATLASLAHVTAPMHIQVFTTPT
jgi:alkyl hydroperoxide reductase subunit AhpF